MFQGARTNLKKTFDILKRCKTPMEKLTFGQFVPFFKLCNGFI